MLYQQALQAVQQEFPSFTAADADRQATAAVAAVVLNMQPQEVLKNPSLSDETVCLQI